jgi:hypothetical protein
MTEFQQYGGTHPIVKLTDDWNNLLSHGLAKACGCVIGYNPDTAKYEAVDGWSGKIHDSSVDPTGVILLALSDFSHVYLQEATYNLTATVIVPSGTILEGPGVGAILHGLAGVTPIVKFPDHVTNSALKSVYITGVSQVNQVGLWLGEYYADYNNIESVKIAFVDICFYCETTGGNVNEVRNMVCMSYLSYAVQINGANQLHFYNLGIACTTAAGNSGICFGPYMARPAYANGLITFAGGWMWQPKICFRWVAAAAEGIRINVSGMGFEDFETMISVEADQNDNLHLFFDGCSTVGTTRALRVLHGAGLSVLSCRARFLNCQWIGAVNGAFDFNDQPRSLMRYYIDGYNKFSSFPAVYTHTVGTTGNIADGGTVTHLLDGTPAKALVQATYAGEMASVTAKGATTITVAIKKHDGTPGTAQPLYVDIELD